MLKNNFGLFVMALFAAACAIGIAYVMFSHPGDTANDVKPLETNQTAP